MMDPERWQRVKQVLATALELGPAERESYLEQSYAEDASLRADLEPLVAVERRLSDKFLDGSDLAVAAATLLPPDEAYWIGRRVGPYKVVEQVGAGGMGEVYRAVRADDQYQKEVALKFVRAGQYSGDIFARFKNERQILAGLDHPNIAKLLDGGATDDGTPYLVMELIEGRPITEYCNVHELSVTERLKLFLQVCSAAHYAHQRLIIHRDIKPGNILVTPGGTPKLLDFGIAKILEPDSQVPLSEATLTNFRVLTPSYASPEQITGQPMTTASDVYSLGVVLYELLTGVSPYAPANTSPQEIAQAVCEREPQKPSFAVKSSPPNREETLDHQSRALPAISGEKLRKQLSGDLDNIVLMSLRKEPSRRYASVNDLQEDIRRHLENIPVIARNDTVLYRATKFVARHKPGVAAALAFALVLIAGIIITMREARIAQRRFNDVRALANSLIFDVHDSVKDLPGSTPARKIIVDRALQYLNVLARESAGDVGLQRELATAYERVGSVQGDYLENNLGDSEGTLASYNKALALRKQINADSSDWNDRLALVQGYRLVAHQLWANGDPRGARDPIERAIAVAEAMNKEQPNNSKILHELGFDYEVSGRIGYPGERLSDQKIIEDYRRALAVDEISLKINPDDIPTLHGYAMDLSDIGGMLEAAKPQEALKNYEKALEIDQKLMQLSPDLRYQRGVAISYGSVASVYDDMGDYPRAVENNLKDLSIYQDMVRADSKNVLLRQGLAITYMNTGASCVRAGQIPLAMDYSNRALEMMRPIASAASKTAFQQHIFAAMLVIRGTILTAANQPDAAITEIELGRAVYESLYKAGTANRVNVAASNVKLGEASAKAGHDQKAADSFHEAVLIAEPLISTDPADLDALYATADAYSGLGDLDMKAARQPGLAAQKRQLYFTQAQSWYQLSLSTWGRIEHPNRTAPNSFQVGDPTVVAKNLKLAEAALATSH
jgi:non-specific serine/threonine protein kinase/serine/threonine-protein kinase